MKKKELSAIENKNKILFIILAVFYIVISYLTNSLIFTNSFYLDILSSSVNTERISSTIQNFLNYQWLGYVSIPILLLIKLLLISSIIYAGFTISETEITFKNIFTIVLEAELIFLIAAVARFACYLIFPINSLDELKRFSPFSIMNLVNDKNLKPYFFYPLQTLNLFELGYWVALAFSIKAITKKTFLKSLLFILITYGSGLLLWMLAVVFVQLQFS